jgi:DNA replicative helicase MCM subunit Mcm2 (Cdc46/Mcm family)
MKGEVIDCSSCNKEVFLPDQTVVHRERRLSFVCPKCRVELEAPEEMAEQSTTCPSCDEQVRLRPKFRLRTDTKFLTEVADSEQLPQDTPSSQPQPAKFPRRFGLLTLLRYGVANILKKSITGSQPGLSQPVQSKPSSKGSMESAIDN